MLSKESKSHPIIIDAKDLLKNPEAMLMQICEKIKIDFNVKMLSWPIGPRKTDGIWGQHWYKQVEASSSFKPFVKTEKISPLNI